MLSKGRTDEFLRYIEGGPERHESEEPQSMEEETYPFDYKFKTKPYQHQLKVFHESRDKECFALLTEQGTGKTKIILDTACYRFNKGDIDALLVIAPNGVHRDWVEIEVPRHLPDYCPYIANVFDAKKTNTKAWRKEHGRFYQPMKSRKLCIFTINVEAIATPKGMQFVKNFVTFKKAMAVVDESTRIKNHKAKRSKVAHAITKYSPVRRILTGTPITQNPLDVFSQFKFLDPKILPVSNYFVFKHRYAITIKRRISRGGKTWEYEDILDWQNLGELKKLLADHSYRVLKKDCLDLPEKIYQPLQVDLKKSKQQFQAYESMRKNLVVELSEEDEDDPTFITAPMAMTKLTKLQQILGGFIMDEGQVYLLDDNVKLDAMLYDMEDISEDTHVIIFARFRAEVEGIYNRIMESKIFNPNKQQVAAKYYGGVSSEERTQIVKDFQSPASPLRFFIGNQAAAGHGITLTAASLVYYFSNDFSLENRLQSEDRPHRIGQHNPVVYKDVVCPGTVDKLLMDTIANKKDMADMLTGDRIVHTLMRYLS